MDEQNYKENSNSSTVHTCANKPSGATKRDSQNKVVPMVEIPLQHKKSYVQNKNQDKLIKIEEKFQNEITIMMEMAQDSEDEQNDDQDMIEAEFIKQENSAGATEVVFGNDNSSLSEIPPLLAQVKKTHENSATEKEYHMKECSPENEDWKLDVYVRAIEKKILNQILSGRRLSYEVQQNEETDCRVENHFDARENNIPDTLSSEETPTCSKYAQINEENKNKDFRSEQCGDCTIEDEFRDEFRNEEHCGKEVESEKQMLRNDRNKDNEANSNKESITKNDTKIGSSTKKKIHSKQHKLSGYNKKQIIKFLREHGCSPENVGYVMNRFKINREDALEYFNNHIENAEKYIHEECASLCFDNNEAWLKLFKSWDIPNKQFYEPAIVLSAIENTEKHPDPKDLGGVDLKALYKFLSNALLGLPQPKLNEETAVFLAGEMEMLVESANTESGDAEILRIHNYLQNPDYDGKAQDPRKISLDPLLMDSNIML